MQQEPVLFSESIWYNVTYGYENPTQEEFENALNMANIGKQILSDKEMFPEG